MGRAWEESLQQGHLGNVLLRESVWEQAALTEVQTWASHSKGKEVITTKRKNISYPVGARQLGRANGKAPAQPGFESALPLHRCFCKHRVSLILSVDCFLC